MSAPAACYECRFFEFSSGSPGYSSWTPGSDMAFGCLKGIWGSGDIANEIDFREKITTAKDCEVFEARPRP